MLVARKVRVGESDPAERLGLSISLRETITPTEAVMIAAMVQACGFKGATFMPKRGEVTIYDTDDLEMTREQFEQAVEALVVRLRARYVQMTHVMHSYLLFMPKL